MFCFCFAKWHWKVLHAAVLVQGDLGCTGTGLKQNLGTAAAVREHCQVQGREETGRIGHIGLRPEDGPTIDPPKNPPKTGENRPERIF